jgi:hypothetical protein
MERRLSGCRRSVIRLPHVLHGSNFRLCNSAPDRRATLLHQKLLELLLIRQGRAGLQAGHHARETGVGRVGASGEELLETLLIRGNRSGL